MTPFDIATGTLIMTIPLIVCAGIIGFSLARRRRKEIMAPLLRPKDKKK